MLTRTTVLESSNSDTAVSFTSGTKDIFITLPAEKAVALDGNDVLSIGNISTSGYLRGPATFTIAGDLQVDGTTTTINSANLAVDDLNITVASGAANAAAANGAGLTVAGAGATFTYDSTNDRWTMNKDLATDVVGSVTGTVSSLSNHDTDDLAEGTNLYYTQARFDAALAGKSTTNVSEGTNLYYTSGRFDTAFTAKSTTDLSEGTNLYYTTGRFDTAFTAKSTTDLSEGTNLYYTTGRFDTALAAKSTTDLAEGTNLYYTDARANTAIDARVDQAFVNNLNVDADTLGGDSKATILSTAESNALALAIALG